MKYEACPERILFSSKLVILQSRVAFFACNKMIKIKLRIADAVAFSVNDVLKKYRQIRSFLSFRSEGFLARYELEENDFLSTLSTLLHILYYFTEVLQQNTKIFSVESELVYRDFKNCFLVSGV